MDLNRLGKGPSTRHRIKLHLQWLVFRDEVGNFVMVDPAANKPLWLDENRRPPTVYLAARDVELHAALREMLSRYERTTRVTPEHVRLVDRVEAALEDHFQRRVRAKRAA